MAQKYTAGSFTKNFSWHLSYKRLHGAIASGFSEGLDPTSREEWRLRSRIGNSDLELIPMNFFLYSKEGIEQDYILVDRLVERSIEPYDKDFAELALFAFHLANSGTWRQSKWRDGAVAGWANALIRELAWRNDTWTSDIFQERPLASFLGQHLEGTSGTRRKVLTNYRYMLRSAGVLVRGKIQPVDRDIKWRIDATQLFWDRQLFDGLLSPSSNRKSFETSYLDHEIYKLLRCSEEQGRAFVAGAFRDYSERLANRVKQVRGLKGLLVA
jgi:hypothetical protein